MTKKEIYRLKNQGLSDEKIVTIASRRLSTFGNWIDRDKHNKAVEKIRGQVSKVDSKAWRDFLSK